MVEKVLLDTTWNRLIVDLPRAHLFQTREWAEVKSKVGWEATPLVWKDNSGEIRAAALVLTRSMRMFRYGPKLSIMYIPRGPLLDWRDRALREEVIVDLQTFARAGKALFLKVDPELMVGTGVPGQEGSADDETGMTALREMKERGWRFSTSQVQFRNTVTLDLSGDEDEWLKRMKQKTRYNLRLAQRNGVAVREAEPEEYPDLYRMYAETSVRDGFMIRPEQYYLDVWEIFRNAGLVSPLVAEVNGEKIAGLVLFHFGKTAWYLYGMSTSQHREKMPNYLLQWEAMRRAREKGCLKYDLWGAPDKFTETDAMAGVFRFKTGLGGVVERTCGAWDYVVSPIGYALYEKGLPWIQNFLRRNRKNETRREIGLG
jgi:lipid II:glycine glycyltransferase (peptidoglycan interpeptide bridge formation enzyme)